MIRILGILISAIVILCLSIAALPLALVAGLVLLILACVGAGSGLAVLGGLVLLAALVLAVFLHILIPLLVPILLICGIIYVCKSFSRAST